MPQEEEGEITYAENKLIVTYIENGDLVSEEQWKLPHFVAAGRHYFMLIIHIQVNGAYIPITKPKTCSSKEELIQLGTSIYRNWIGDPAWISKTVELRRPKN
jgi:hypothetical protein